MALMSTLKNLASTALKNSKSSLASNYSPIASTLASNYANLKAPSASTLASTFANNNATNKILASIAPSASSSKAATISTPLRSIADPLLQYNTDFANSSAYKQLANAASAYSSAANPIDLTDIIASYNKNNQATIDTLNKTLTDTINTLKSSNETSRNDLLTALKRFQESNAESMRTQQQDFNASRATLEDEAFMNQRNAMANASSRGLGGSGLQQLAQLQNRLAAGKNVSNLALKNQTAQDALRKALTQQQEDYKTGVTKLNKELANAITDAQNKTAQQVNAANTNNTNLINQLIYNEQVRQQNAKAQASSARAGLDSLLSNMKEGVTTLQGAQKSFDSALGSAVSSYLASKGKSDVSKLSSRQKTELNNSLNALYNSYVTKVGGDLENYGNVAASYGLDSSYTDTAISNLRNIYNKYNVYPASSGGWR